MVFQNLFSPRGFTPKGPITHLCVQNEVMLVVCSGKILQHVRLQNDKCTDVEIPLSTVDRIAYIHTDYNGTHAIVSSVSGDNFYLHMKTLVMKQLRRLKGITISAVGWNLDYARDSETAFTVLGTTKGVVLESNITSSGNIQYLKTLTTNLNQDGSEVAAEDVQETNVTAITDLHLHQCSENEDDRFVLLICMPEKMYALCGTVNLNATFQQQQSSQPVVGTVWSSVMMEQPQAAVLQSLFNLGEARLCCHRQSEESAILPSGLAVYPIALNESPNKYCWLSSAGLTMGSIDTSKEVAGKSGSKRISSDAYDMIVEEAHVKHKRVEGRFDYPLDIALTEYHLVLLYSNRIMAISLLDQSVAFEETIKGSSKVLGMTKDVSSRFIWVFTESSLFKYRPFEETRHIWRIYLERREFGKARKITSQMVHEDPAPYQMVIKKEAEKFIADKNYAAAAELLAHSLEPFEAIVLKFLKDGSASRNGLKRFLELKLNKMDRSEDKVRRDILVIWLLEIQLGELAELRRSHYNEQVDRFEVTASTTSSKDTITAREAEVKKLREEFYCFLNRAIVNESINNNRPAVYRMVSSHVDFETQLHLANKLRDYDVVIKILLLQRNYKQVLEVLVQQANAQFFYRYAPEMITQTPMELVKALIENKRILQPTHLLPVFYKCFDTNTASSNKKIDSKVLAATFFYLDHIVGGQDTKVDPTVHNFFVQLHATFKPTTLLDHLKKFGKKRSKLTYDVEIALRICLEKRLTECCVFLYCILGLYDSAVKLALTISVELGIKCAKELNHRLDRHSDKFMLQMSTDPDDSNAILDDLDEATDGRRSSEELRRQVWLEIAKRMIETNQQDVVACLGLLKESNEAIKIQDILPYFPEFTKIEHFKEPLCACLKEHFTQIQQLQREMREASEMADEISADAEKNKSKFMIVKSSDTCFKCKDVLLSKPFFAFTCRHFFHKKCLESHMIREKEFSKEESQRYARLVKEEKVLRKRVEMMRLDGRQRQQAIADCKATQDQIRALLAEDCPMCGNRIVDSIDKPLFNLQDYQEELKLWSFS